MPTANDSIAFALTTSQTMFKRFLSDLSPQDYLHRPAPKANCAAWIVGHLALSERGVLKRLGSPLPDLPEGFDKRFSRDEGCPQAAEFGDVSEIAGVFDEHRRRLIETVKAMPPEGLDKALDKAHPMFRTVGEMVTFMALHATMHAGQISTIRRSLGRPPLI